MPESTTSATSSAARRPVGSGSPASHIVVISGAGSGIGRETALHLHDLGYTVVAGFRSDSQGASLAEAAGGSDRMIPVRFDVTSDAEMSDAVARVRHLVDSGLRLRAVFSNAGMDSRSADLSAEGAPVDAVGRVMEVNFLGAVRFVQAFLPLLRAARGTVVINSALMARIVLPFNGGYASSKAALESWAVSLRREIAPHGVHVVLLELGGIATPLTRHSGAPQAPNPLYPEQIVITREFARMASRGSDDPRMAPRRAAELVARAVAAERPRTRYIGGGGAHLLAAVAVMPQRVQDMLIRAMLRRGMRSD